MRVSTSQPPLRGPQVPQSPADLDKPRPAFVAAANSPATAPARAATWHIVSCPTLERAKKCESRGLDFGPRRITRSGVGGQRRTGGQPWSTHRALPATRIRVVPKFGDARSIRGRRMWKPPAMGHATGPTRLRPAADVHWANQWQSAKTVQPVRLQSRVSLVEQAENRRELVDQSRDLRCASSGSMTTASDIWR